MTKTSLVKPCNSRMVTALPKAMWSYSWCRDEILMVPCVVRTWSRSLYRSKTRTVAAAGGEGREKGGDGAEKERGEGEERSGETAEGTKEE